MSVSSVFTAAGFVYSATQPAKPARGNVWDVNFSDKARYDTPVGGDYVLCLGGPDYPISGAVADALTATFLTACNALGGVGTYGAAHAVSGSTTNSLWIGVSASVTAMPVPGTTFAPADPTQGITYNVDDTVATVTENGVVTTFTYNADKTIATSQRGSGPVRNYTYSAGKLTGVV